MTLTELHKVLANHGDTLESVLLGGVCNIDDDLLRTISNTVKRIRHLNLTASGETIVSVTHDGITALGELENLETFHIQKHR